MIVVDHFQRHLNGVLQIDRSFDHRRGLLFVGTLLHSDEDIQPAVNLREIDVVQLSIEIVQILDQRSIVLVHFDVEERRRRPSVQINGQIQLPRTAQTE